VNPDLCVLLSQTIQSNFKTASSKVDAAVEGGAKATKVLAELSQNLAEKKASYANHHAKATDTFDAVTTTLASYNAKRIAVRHISFLLLFVVSRACLVEQSYLSLVICHLMAELIRSMCISFQVKSAAFKAKEQFVQVRDYEKAKLKAAENHDLNPKSAERSTFVSYSFSFTFLSRFLGLDPNQTRLSCRTEWKTLAKTALNKYHTFLSQMNNGRKQAQDARSRYYKLSAKYHDLSEGCKTEALDIQKLTLRIGLQRQKIDSFKAGEAQGKKSHTESKDAVAAQVQKIAALKAKVAGLDKRRSNAKAQYWSIFDMKAILTKNQDKYKTQLLRLEGHSKAMSTKAKSLEDQISASEALLLDLKNKKATAAKGAENFKKNYVDQGCGSADTMHAGALPKLTKPPPLPELPVMTADEKVRHERLIKHAKYDAFYKKFLEQMHESIKSAGEKPQFLELLEEGEETSPPTLKESAEENLKMQVGNYCRKQARLAVASLSAVAAATAAMAKQNSFVAMAQNAEVQAKQAAIDAKISFHTVAQRVKVLNKKVEDADGALKTPCPA